MSRKTQRKRLEKAAIRYGETMVKANVREAQFIGDGYIIVFERVDARTPKAPTHAPAEGTH